MVLYHSMFYLGTHYYVFQKRNIIDVHSICLYSVKCKANLRKRNTHLSELTFEYLSSDLVSLLNRVFCSMEALTMETNFIYTLQPVF